MDERIRISRREEYVAAVKEVLLNGSAALDPGIAYHILSRGKPEGVFNGYPMGGKVLVTIGKKDAEIVHSTSKDTISLRVKTRRVSLNL